MNEKLKHNEWTVGANVQSNDEGGGDPCAHCEDLTMKVEPGGKLIGAWRLPLAVQMRFHDSIRNICIYCIQDKITELMELIQAESMKGAE